MRAIPRSGGGAASITASTTAAGIVELATSDETLTGTDTERAVTPAGLSSLGLTSLSAAAPNADFAFVGFRGGLAVFEHQFTARDVHDTGIPSPGQWYSETHGQSGANAIKSAAFDGYKLSMVYGTHADDECSSFTSGGGVDGASSPPMYGYEFPIARGYRWRVVWHIGFNDASSLNAVEIAIAMMWLAGSTTPWFRTIFGVDGANNVNIGAFGDISPPTTVSGLTDGQLDDGIWISYACNGDGDVIMEYALGASGSRPDDDGWTLGKSYTGQFTAAPGNSFGCGVAMRSSDAAADPTGYAAHCDHWEVALPSQVATPA